MTRGGAEMRRPEGVFNSTSGLGSGADTGGGWGAGGVVGISGGTDWEGLFCGKSGVVFAVGGAPVRGGAEGLGGT
jgi:hypothetical protein